ncbi:eRF1 methyltransferase catalytic subunit MTQ2 [Blumeria hordei DH14]|uniref:ERF1 methyltransferase catalytic subunit MTQ2 n=1 Tax=Blumeria graminis f. sp. hordei (strain DH14) TaxID=546991 RepID=N1J7I1_BLUG1|nr:eRF1 methyltransferase catalytic subunit MTQ2 [Blumeria hordei DH14]
MLPTPCTAHVDLARIYEPAEDSYLLLDTVSSTSERAFLHARFGSASPGQAVTPLVVEIGSGSGVIISFVHAHCATILGRCDVLTAGIDVNFFACQATVKTVAVAQAQNTTKASFMGSIQADLASSFRGNEMDVLIFNPPYVPTPYLPKIEHKSFDEVSFQNDSHLLSLSYAGGVDGMEIIERFLDCLPDMLNSVRGCAYLLLCAQNKPDQIKSRIRKWGNDWLAETVGESGKTAGWEKLQIIRIWRT